MECQVADLEAEIVDKWKVAISKQVKIVYM